MSIVTSKYVLIKEFLTQELNEELVTYTLNNESSFAQRLITPGYPQQYSFGASNGFDFWKLHIIEQVKLRLPEVLKIFDIDFNIGEIESDVSGFLDMGFLGSHNDTFCASSRILTFVYYFSREAFSGGQLALYDSEVDCFLRDKQARSCQLIKPVNNSCVIFPSRCWHEVLPVSSDFKTFPNNYFRGGRFSISGWINRN